MSVQVTVKLSPDDFDQIRKSLEFHVEWLDGLKRQCLKDQDKDGAWDAERELLSVQRVIDELK